MNIFTRSLSVCLLFLSVGQLYAALPATSALGLTLSEPTYDCTTRQLTLRANGGNGSPIEYMVAGQSRWSSSPTLVLEAAIAADAAPLTLLARQANGANAPEVASRAFSVATVCGGGKTNVDPVAPAKNTGLTLTEPTYNCGTSELTIQTAGGNGNGIEYMVAGQSRWLSSASLTLDKNIANDAPVVMVLARQKSETGTPFVVNRILDIRSRCGGNKISSPATDATPTGLTLGTPVYDCATRQIKIQTNGGNGTPIEYLVIGQGRWSSSATAVLESAAIADNGTVVVLARQRNAQGIPTNVQQSVNTRTLCSGR